MSDNKKSVRKARSPASKSPPTSPRSTDSSSASTSRKTFTVTQCPATKFAVTNLVYLNENDVKNLTLSRQTKTDGLLNYLQISSTRVGLLDIIYAFLPHPAIEPNQIGMNSFQRRTTELCLDEEIEVLPFIPAASTNKAETNNDFFLASIEVEVDLSRKTQENPTLSIDTIHQRLKRFQSHFFTVNQLFIADVSGNTLKFCVKKLQVLSLSSSANLLKESQRGMLTDSTEFKVTTSPESRLKVTGGQEDLKTGALKGKIVDWDLKGYGVGGLDKEFSDIIRRAFAPRLIPKRILEQMNLTAVRGILLYGPPGTGKSLMACKIGEMLRGKKPTIIKGPEILSKYVGVPEENIRKLFAEAENEWKAKGDESGLHVLIFDELDAICKKRGSSPGDTGVGDRVVNQLLTCLEGVEKINNILVIGMTNRIDMIDDALLRPGRLEMHIEVSLPDEAGRKQILDIHTKASRNSGRIDENVELTEFAKKTRNWTGAELGGMVNNAGAYACARQLNIKDPTDIIDVEGVKITYADMQRAYESCKPKFGVSINDFKREGKNGVLNFGPGFLEVKNECKMLFKQLQSSDRTKLMTILLEGDVGCGKSSLAVRLAARCKYPFVKIINPSTLNGMTEYAKNQEFNKYFNDAYKSDLSVIVMDDVERLLGYAPIGPAYSNTLLQSLLVGLTTEAPDTDSVVRKLLVVATSSNLRFLKQLDILKYFTVVMHMPNVSGKEVKSVLTEIDGFDHATISAITHRFEHEKRDIPIKKLFLIAERALMDATHRGQTLEERFFYCLEKYSHI